MTGPAAALAIAVVLAPGPAGSPLPELSVCEVLASWRDHHGKVVRVHGTYTSGFERSSLSGTACTGKRVWVDWTVEPPDARADALRTEMRRAGRLGGVRVVIEGVFHGPAPRANGTAARYGHLGACVARLEVTKVHSVRKGEPAR